MEPPPGIRRDRGGGAGGGPVTYQRHDADMSAGGRNKYPIKDRSRSKFNRGAYEEGGRSSSPDFGFRHSHSGGVRDRGGGDRYGGHDDGPSKPKQSKREEPKYPEEELEEGEVL